MVGENDVSFFRGYHLEGSHCYDRHKIFRQKKNTIIYWDFFQSDSQHNYPQKSSATDK